MRKELIGPELNKLGKKYGIGIESICYNPDEDLHYFHIKNKNKSDVKGYFGICVEKDKIEMYRINIRNKKKGYGTKVFKTLVDYCKKEGYDYMNILRYTNHPEIIDKIGERIGIKPLLDDATIPTIVLKIEKMTV